MPSKKKAAVLAAASVLSGAVTPTVVASGRLPTPDRSAKGKLDYTPDSAATGTAWATGVKTYDNAISVDRKGKSYATLLELAKRSGPATGDITTSEIQVATPAVQVSHISARSCYGPATFAEVAAAGNYEGKTLEDRAKAPGYNYLTAKRDLVTVASADQKRPLLGLFPPGNMPVKFAPLLVTVGGANGPAATWTPEPTFSQVPDLRTMTIKAIDVLSHNKACKRKASLLQVESASIDKKDHAADACGQIGETEQLDEAVGEALRFARKDGSPPGPTARLATSEGSEMTVSCGAAALGSSRQHTGSQVRVAGYGPGATNLVGLIDQTDLHFIVRRTVAARQGVADAGCVIRTGCYGDLLV